VFSPLKTENPLGKRKEVMKSEEEDEELFPTKSGPQVSADAGTECQRTRNVGVGPRGGFCVERNPLQFFRRKDQ